MKKTVTNIVIDNNEDKFISIAPIESGCVDEEARKNMLELQLLMATSSINHEYARMEFEEAESTERKEELLEYMHDCRTQYFRAREDLERFNPYALKEFEEDLIRQKSSMLSQYNA
jgi:hypothetical protein